MRASHVERTTQLLPVRDRRYPTSLAVVQHYDEVSSRRLSAQNTFDLMDYLKALETPAAIDRAAWVATPSPAAC